MTQKISCPQCGESNYESSPACWACGTPLKGPRAQTPPPEAPAAAAPDVITPEVVAPETTQVETLFEAAPEVMEPLDSTPPPAVDAEAPPPGDTSLSGPKPAEIEARKLREKDYVTPPVEVDERPKSAGEWIAYTFQALGASTGGFKESLDEYDRRRGHKSGTFSSFGCLVTALTIIITIALMVWVLSPHTYNAVWHIKQNSRPFSRATWTPQSRSTRTCRWRTGRQRAPARRRPNSACRNWTSPTRASTPTPTTTVS